MKWISNTTIFFNRCNIEFYIMVHTLDGNMHPTANKRSFLTNNCSSFIFCFIRRKFIDNKNLCWIFAFPQSLYSIVFASLSFSLVFMTLSFHFFAKTSKNKINNKNFKCWWFFEMRLNLLQLSIQSFYLCIYVISIFFFIASLCFFSSSSAGLEKLPFILYQEDYLRRYIRSMSLYAPSIYMCVKVKVF